MKLFSLLIVLTLLFSCSSDKMAEPQAEAGMSLFNGKDLSGWKVSGFGGDGEIMVKDGAIFMDYGNPMTGLTYTGKTPKINYEVSLEAQKVDGNDFFVGLTVPYEDTHLSLLLGGWGGVTCGISSFDVLDASENDTTFVKMFHKKKWYKVKLQIMKSRIRAFIDDEKVIDKELTGQSIGTRPEIDPSKPFGLAAFETQALYRNIKVREIEDMPEDL